MEFINADLIPFAKREKVYVKLVYCFGYDENGNYGKGKVGEVIAIDNGSVIENGSYFNYIQQAKDFAIEKANELGLNFIYFSYN